ncbi:MAG: S41 family peptidase [Thermoleophilia bacterium]
MERLLRNTLIVTFVVLLLVVIFTAGLVIGLHPQTRAALDGLMDFTVSAGEYESIFPLQREVLRELESGYYREIDLGELQDDAVRGLLEGLGDEYTSYMTPEEYDLFREHAGGAYSGVGMTVEMKAGLVTVVSTFEGSPAEEAGLQPGDIILGVDGESVRGEQLEEVVSKIKGPEGTRVDLRIYRLPAEIRREAFPEDAPQDEIHLPEGGETLELTLERREISIPVVRTEIERAPDGTRVLYLRFLTFSEESSEKLRRPLERYVSEGDIDHVVLDLRRNGGGLLAEAVDVASLFIEDGIIVTTEGLNSPPERYVAEGDAFESVNLYVLVDEFSASASEIVAGALQDTSRGLLIGEKTFGKGLVQTVEPLSNGGALKITTAVYKTPSGRDINEKGIEPDIEAPDDETTEVDETLERALELISEGGVRE